MLYPMQLSDAIYGVAPVGLCYRSSDIAAATTAYETAYIWRTPNSTSRLTRCRVLPDICDPMTGGYCCSRRTGIVPEGIVVAKRTIHMLVDDIDGGEADETVRFAVDGVQYEIDLSTKNATKMRDALARYIEAGSKVGRTSGGTARVTAGRGRGPATVDRDQNRAIREWAQGKGIAVSDRGRIKQEIVDRYHAEAGR